jgi:hypothetical protein
MYKVKNPHERIHAVLLPRITKLLCLTQRTLLPFFFRLFPCLFHCTFLYFISMFAARRLGEVQRSLFLDNAGSVHGRWGRVWRYALFYRLSALLRPLRPTQLDVAGIASKSHPVDPRKRRLLQSCCILLIDGRLRPCYASHHLAEVLVPSGSSLSVNQPTCQVYGPLIPFNTNMYCALLTTAHNHLFIHRWLARDSSTYLLSIPSK